MGILAGAGRVNPSRVGYIRVHHQFDRLPGQSPPCADA